MDRNSHRAHQLPPPDGFNGNEDGDHGDEDYNRQCTPDEWMILDRRFPDAFVDEQDDLLEANEAMRDAYFAELAEETNFTAQGSQESAHPEPVEASLPPANGPSTSSGGALLGDRPDLALCPPLPRPLPASLSKPVPSRVEGVGIYLARRLLPRR